MPEQNLTEQIARMRSTGLGNEEIAQRLLYQGYSNSDVFDAINLADTSSVTEAPSEIHSEQFSYRAPSDSNSIDTNKISEIAESIIEEKWSDLVDHVNRIIEWKSTIEMKIAAMDEQIKNIRADFEVLQKGVLGRIGETDVLMRDVSTDIKALEQVFKKILPGFVENVNELSKITQNLKRK